METDLTKQIKRRIPGWRPLFNSSKRTIRYAYEVWTPTGIVDVIRFEEAYTGGFHAAHDCRMGVCVKDQGATYPNEKCSGCIFQSLSNVHDIEIVTTCFEVKITVSDFKSENGHNFHGNLNYYVVPVDIYESILPLVKYGIGIIAYYPKSGHMVEKRKSERRELSTELYAQLLYDALRKWVDAVWYEYDHANDAKKSG